MCTWCLINININNITCYTHHLVCTKRNPSLIPMTFLNKRHLITAILPTTIIAATSDDIHFDERLSMLVKAAYARISPCVVYCQNQRLPLTVAIQPFLISGIWYEARVTRWRRIVIKWPYTSAGEEKCQYVLLLRRKWRRRPYISEIIRRAGLYLSVLLARNPAAFCSNRHSWYPVRHCRRLVIASM